MKRNLSSQAIKAMAIGMAVTMGATTALSGVGGNVAVVKAEEAAAEVDDKTAPAGITNTGAPDNSSNKYAVVNSKLLFEITASDSTPNNPDAGTAKLIGMLDAELTSISSGTGAIATPFGAKIEEGVLTITSDSTNEYIFNVDTLDNNGDNGSTNKLTGSVSAEILNNAVTKVATIGGSGTNTFDGITITGTTPLNFPALTTLTDTTAFKGSTIEGGLTIGGAITGIAANAFEGTTIKGDLVLSSITGLTSIGNSAFKNATIEGKLDLSAATTLATVDTSAFEGATIGTEAGEDALVFGATSTLTIGQNAFKKATINGNLDLSAVTTTLTLTSTPFKGDDAETSKGITVTGALKLKLGTTLAANELDYVDINTLDLTGMTTTATTFTGSKFGTLTLPSDYVGVANAFDSTTITELKFGTSFSGTVAANAFAGATKGATIITLDLTNVTGDKLDNAFKASDSDFTKGANITNITNHNGITKLGACTVSGNVAFADVNVGSEIFKDTKFEAGSTITIADQTKIETTSTDAFKFAEGSKTNIVFTDYTSTDKETDIKTAFGTGLISGKVNILLPKGKDTEVASLNTALTGVTGVTAYLNNATAGIDNPAAAPTYNKNDYIITADGKLFQIITTSDVTTAEVAYVGKVETAGNGGTANGTNIPYVGVLSDSILTVTTDTSKEFIVTQIGNGTDALSTYTLMDSSAPQKGNVMAIDNLDVPAGKSIKIANNAFEGATISAITSTEGVTSIGENAFKNATITGTLNTTNVTSFGASAFEGATLLTAQTIVVSEEALSTLSTNAFDFTSAAATTIIKLEAYNTTDKAKVVAALGSDALENVTVEIPYSLTAEVDAQNLTEALTSTGVTATVAAKGNEGTEAPKANDIISTTSGDVFEVLTPQAGETAGTVKLVSLGNSVQSRAAVTTFAGTFAEGVVTVTYNNDKTATFNVTEIGDGSKAITTEGLTAETLAPYLTNATKLADKALEGVSITADPSVSITIPETLTELGATSLQLKNDSAIVIKVPNYTEAGITKDELVAAIGTTNAQITIELPAGSDSAALKEALATTAPKVEVRTELPADTSEVKVKATNEKGTYTFEIIQQPEDQEPVKEVRLVAFEEAKAPIARTVQATFQGNTVTINGEGYTLTELGNGKEPVSGLTADALVGHTGSVTTIAPKAFEGNTNITAVSSSGSTENAIYLPALVQVGENAFAGATSLTTVKLENVTEVKDSAFSKTGVTTVELPKATTIGASAFANNEKLTVVNVGTKADGQIKMDSTALSGSSNITVVNTNTASKDQVTEAIKQSGTKNNVTVSAGGTTETVKPETTTSKPSISGGGANIGTSASGSNTETTTETTTSTETTTETTTQTQDKTLSLDVISLPSVEGTAVSFSDVSDSSWAKPYIDKLSTAGIINGSNGKFNPNGQTKRADVTVMLVKLLGLTPETNNKFTDVDANAYYAPYVGAASSYGIVNGSNGMFKPESVISRQDTMVMISQILKGLNLNVNTDTSVLTQFSDVNNISGYAQESVAILVNSGIISGSNGKLNPTKAVTRAEMATIMSKLYDVISSASNN